MITGEKDKLDEIARNYICAEHKTRVVVTWQGKQNTYVLACEKGEFPEEVTRNPSLTELYKQGEELPEPIKSNVKKALETRAAMLPKTPGAQTFTGVPATDLGTGELLKIEVIKALVDYAHKYELDPARGHVCLMYGKPYITIDGYLFHAHQVNLPFSMNSRPLKGEERQDNQLGESDYAWLTKVLILSSGAEFSGIGIVTAEERAAKSKKNPAQLAAPVVAAHPWQMAQKRADWQALRRAFPIGESPQGEEE